jgi:hypothetical protein
MSFFDNSQIRQRGPYFQTEPDPETNFAKLLGNSLRDPADGGVVGPLPTPGSDGLGTGDVISGLTGGLTDPAAGGPPVGGHVTMPGPGQDDDGLPPLGTGPGQVNPSSFGGAATMPLIGPTIAPLVQMMARQRLGSGLDNTNTNQVF